MSRCLPLALRPETGENRRTTPASQREVWLAGRWLSPEADLAKTYHRSLPRRLLDRAVAAAVRMGIGPADYFLLSVSGRVSGNEHTTPVRVVIWQGDRWLVAPYGVVEWVKNARASGRVRLSRGNRSEVVELREVQSEHRAPLLKRYAELEPVTRRHLSPSGDHNLDAYEVLAAERPVFMILPPASPISTQAAA